MKTTWSLFLWSFCAKSDEDSERIEQRGPTANTGARPRFSNCRGHGDVSASGILRCPQAPGGVRSPTAHHSRTFQEHASESLLAGVQRLAQSSQECGAERAHAKPRALFLPQLLAPLMPICPRLHRAEAEAGAQKKWPVREVLPCPSRSHRSAGRRSFSLLVSSASAEQMERKPWLGFMEVGVVEDGRA